MRTVESIVDAVKNLSDGDLARFRDWFVQFDAGRWDAQIEANAKAGKLDRLAAVALAEYAVRGDCGSREIKG